MTDKLPNNVLRPPQEARLGGVDPRDAPSMTDKLPVPKEVEEYGRHRDGLAPWPIPNWNAIRICKLADAAIAALRAWVQAEHEGRVRAEEECLERERCGCCRHSYGGTDCFAELEAPEPRRVTCHDRCHFRTPEEPRGKWVMCDGR